ncbi:hypothetical protein J4421_01460 [Candidatus Woesearchaeota archaeon]|nr:hypothetical protein [Candidatus Woesearchaeota archaeon]
MKKGRFVFAAASFLIALNAAFAAAYLDPNSGSLLLQILLGIVATVAIMTKGIKYRIKSFFQRIFNK